MIDVKNLTKWYNTTLAVDDVSFRVEKGSVVGFLGPNGAGKTTTLKIITSYLPATSGTVTVNGFDVLGESIDVRGVIGYMPENTPLYPEMRVREYLSFRAKLRGIPPKQRKAAIERVAERCWLSKPENMMRRRLSALSRGYQQRVGLAEVLLHAPPVLILDEPTIGLDPAQIRDMRTLIGELGGEHTIILSSHILAEVEQTCSNIIIIAGGQVVAQGPPNQLRGRVVGLNKVLAEISDGGTGDTTEDILRDIKAMPGVNDVSCEAVKGWLHLEISTDPRSDVREKLFDLTAEKQWALRELRQAKGSLEDFFVQITYEQTMQAGARA
ncbi:MAG: ATP-binding cassette domain-containing protein [Phycisphaerae bacterium]|nr:ATP-binding cassette domain-containing protein [Phycisphaerae bacterium]